MLPLEVGELRVVAITKKDKRDVDIGPTLARIDSGGKDRHPNDGSTFRNDKSRLPVKPDGYYKEFVHRTEGVKGVGPQRVVVGGGGERYYTPDHSKTFVPIK